jgi:hypothetical protein
MGAAERGPEDTPVAVGPAAAGGMADLAYCSTYDLLGTLSQVATSSVELQETLDRLNSEFRVDASAMRPGRHVVRYEAIYHATAGMWELTCDGAELPWFSGLLGAVSYLEWHLCDRAIEHRQDLLHIHGAALAGAEASLLLPGTSGIGKTTLALAAALRGLRLLSDDVIFLHTDTWQPECFPRSFHIHADALPRLAALGLRYRPEEVIGAYLCASALRPWHRAPGPPVRFVIFPRFDPHGPLALRPITGAEAAVELMRYSKNLRRFPRFGLDLVPRLLEGAECFVLERNDDLAAAADVLVQLAAVSWQARPA